MDYKFGTLQITFAEKRKIIATVTMKTRPFTPRSVILYNVILWPHLLKAKWSKKEKIKASCKC